MSTYQPGPGHDDGVQFPNTKLGFYGTTPAAQPASASQAVFTATLVTTIAATLVTTVAATAVTAVTTDAAYSSGTTTAVYGFSQAQADAIRARVNQLVTDVGAYDDKVNQAVTDLTAMDDKINQAVVDFGNLETLVNQLRSELVTLGLIKGSA